MSICRQLSTFCAAAALVLLCAARAQAHSTFPTLIAADLNMPCVPACTICHRDTLGGFGTVSEPFGKAMQVAGLNFTEPSLSPALTKLEQDQTDSDGDGEGDIAELREGRDPNGKIDLCGQAALAARYGCGAHIATPPSQNDASPAVGALLTALVLGASLQRNARRRRRSRPSPSPSPPCSPPRRRRHKV